MKYSGKEKQEDFTKKVLNTIENIKDTAVKNSEDVKNSVTNVAHNASNTIKDIQTKTEGVIEELKNGGKELGQDINKFTKNISKKLK